MAKARGKARRASTNSVGPRLDQLASQDQLHRQDLLVFAILLLAVMIAYHPAWYGARIWDDDAHITRPELRSWGGLWRIWFELGATQQYYPLAHSAFWTEAQLWGDHLLGYHLVNIVLHALSHPRCPWQFWTKPPIPESIRQKRIVQNGLMGRRLVWFSLFYSFALVQALGQKSLEGVGLIRDYVPEGKPREQRHISTVEQCQAACATNARCKAYAFRTVQPACYFYSKVFMGGGGKFFYSSGLSILPKPGFVSAFKHSSFPPPFVPIHHQE